MGLLYSYFTQISDVHFCRRRWTPNTSFKISKFVFPILSNWLELPWLFFEPTRSVEVLWPLCTRGHDFLSEQVYCLLKLIVLHVLALNYCWPYNQVDPKTQVIQFRDELEICNHDQLQETRLRKWLVLFCYRSCILRSELSPDPPLAWLSRLLRVAVV